MARTSKLFPLAGTFLLVSLTTAACGDGDGTGPGDGPDDQPGDMCPASLGPIVSYPFSGNANDASGNGNHGTAQGATLVADRFGNPGAAYAFDGVADAISIGPGGQAPYPITISLWFNQATNTFAHAFANDDANDAANRWGIGMLIGPDGHVGANVYQGFSAPWNRLTNSSPAGLFDLNEWHHVVIVFSAHRDRTIYLDGTEQPSEYSGTGGSMQNSGGSGLIGRMHGNGNPKFQFEGMLDDIKVFDRALTAAEVAQLFTLASGCS